MSTGKADYFAIIANDNDHPLYEALFTSSSTNSSAELFPFIANSTLDIVEDIQWKTSNDELQQHLQLQQQLSMQQQPANLSGATATDGAPGSSSTVASFFGSKSSNQTSGNSNNAQVSLGSLYLGCIDHYYQTPISAYITFGNVKFILIHASNSIINNTNTKIFYQLVHELYIKTIMNPFYCNGDVITSPMFDAKVRAFAAKYF